MKRLIVLAALGTTTLGTALAFAGPGKHNPAARFAELDQDKDGKVTAIEFRAAHAARFKSADKNGDGVVTREELTLAHQAARTAHLDQMFAAKDANKDGRLSKEEAKDLPERRFARLDADNDGFLTKSELTAAKPPHAQKRGDHHFTKLDQNGNGQLEQSELAAPQGLFERLDQDGDGALTLSEFESARGKAHRGHRGHSGHEKHPRGHQG